MADFRKGIGVSDEERSPMVLTVDEVAEALRVRKPVIYGMVNRGELRSIRTGHQIRIPYSAFLALLDGVSSPPSTRALAAPAVEATS